MDNHDGTATLAGTPALDAGGTYSLVITAANGVSPDATQNFSLVVAGAAPTIRSADHAGFTAGSAGSFVVTATGSPTWC